MPTDDAPATTEPAKPDLAKEVKRACERRKALGIDRPFGPRAGQWGLALSGGGIRSATFCLGVLQGLALLTGRGDERAAQAGRPLLAQFDYLSTVSGGGYIGGFFSSLFVPKRLDPAKADPKAVAEQAYRVFLEEPPGRLRSDVTFDPERPGRAAIAWLRENGRYMTPNGAGDLVYALTIYVRNWFGTHYVIGMALLSLFALLAAARYGLLAWGLTATAPAWLTDFTATERMALESARVWQDLWPSPWWWLLAPLLVLWVLPAGLAYWFTQLVDRGKSKEGTRIAESAPVLDAASRPFTPAMVVAILVGLLLLLFAWTLDARADRWNRVLNLAGAAGFVAVWGALWYSVTTIAAKTVTAHRVLLTRRLTNGMVALVIVAFLAAVETLAQTLYLHWERWTALVTPAALAGLFAWLANRVADMAGERRTGGVLAKLPLSAVAAVAGAALAGLVALTWAVFVQWIIWRGETPGVDAIACDSVWREMAIAGGVAAVIGMGLSAAAGYFPGFLNLSSLHNLYSARLTRAYLGASNHGRFDPAVTDPKEIARRRSVAEPIPGDTLRADRLYANPYAPMHIINVCLNQTVDPGENLVQRDRKGRPLSVVCPGGLWLDQEGHPMPEPDAKTEVAAPISAGEWIALSGAAFSTGLGRRTSTGLSLLMGLANVRLGRWWPTGIHRDRITHLDRGLRRVVRTQRYLASEFLAQFQGTRREWQYLSDGGHFENTGVYELLRPERQVSLIVCCDCGADPDYRFEDLANLARLARIDFGIELSVEGRTSRFGLGEVFASVEDFRKPPGGDEACALLVRIARRRMNDGQELPDAWMIVLKPRVLASSSADVRHYHATHDAFPQQPTSDQFFDEAQWESYRRLGLEVARRVFGSLPAFAHGQ